MGLLALLVSLFSAGFFLYAAVVTAAVLGLAALLPAASLMGLEVRRSLASTEIELGGTVESRLVLHNRKSLPGPLAVLAGGGRSRPRRRGGELRLPDAGERADDPHGLHPPQHPPGAVPGGTGGDRGERSLRAGEAVQGGPGGALRHRDAAHRAARRGVAARPPAGPRDPPPAEPVRGPRPLPRRARLPAGGRPAAHPLARHRPHRHPAGQALRADGARRGSPRRGDGEVRLAARLGRDGERSRRRARRDGGGLDRRAGPRRRPVGGAALERRRRGRALSRRLDRRELPALRGRPGGRRRPPADPRLPAAGGRARPRRLAARPPARRPGAADPRPRPDPARAARLRRAPPAALASWCW